MYFTGYDRKIVSLDKNLPRRRPDPLPPGRLLRIVNEKEWSHSGGGAAEQIVPSTDNKLGGLNSAQWQDLCNCVSRLEKSLQSGADAVDLRGYLPPPEAPHRRAVFYELIKAELAARYRRGQGCLLEEFLRRYPELGRADELPAGLLYEEYLVRKLHGERPALDEYRAHFPAQFEQLVELVRRHAPPEALPDVPPRSEFGTVGPSGIPATHRASPLAPPGSSAPAPVMSLPEPSGSKLSQQLSGSQGYQLLERIGKGQFGEVYRALAPGGVVVAIKRIFRSLDDEASQRELKALQQIRELRHPFLLQLHNFQAFEDRLLIVMELADGSLEDRLKECQAAGRSGIPVEELLRYFTEAAEALDFLHQQKLAHRDIKPQNLLHLKGHAKVADFGIARPQLNALDHTLNVGGTPAYMAPEMWHGNISVHSDQYSLALTWYEMRTGRGIFRGKTYLEIAQQHLAEEQPVVPGLPAAEQKILQRALAKEPDQRFPSCVAFVQALAEVIAPVKPEPSRRERRLPFTVGSLGLALAAMLIFLSIVFWSRLQPPPQRNSEPRKSPEVVVSWQPEGWTPENDRTIPDRLGNRYYERLVCTVGGQQVTVVAVPQTHSEDPLTFYAMENKVWNDLYAVFMADPKAGQLLQRYSTRPGCEHLVRGEWRKGAYAPNFNPDPFNEPFFGVEGPEKGNLPVFRVTVTEAHCFAEWLGNRLGAHLGVRLPTRREWLKAAGCEEDSMQTGPIKGDPQDKSGLALALKSGPWPVSRGDRDVSTYGCRQMASNGYEWTRDLADNEPGKKEIPLEEMLLPRSVFHQGQSYLALEPLTFRLMREHRTRDCTEPSFEVSFRVVLER
jgi:serine/threonine protein kinase